VLVGVNGLNLAAFRAFAGDLATELAPDVAAVREWCLAARTSRREAGAHGFTPAARPSPQEGGDKAVSPG
jgi:hypothetical protein